MITPTTLLFALALRSAEAPADPRANNPHYRAAQAAFADDRWEDAVAALAQAYALDARPEYLFMQAQVLRAHDRCDAAILLYREFIATAPPREDVLAAQAGLELCGATTPAVEDSPPPAPIAAKAATPTPELPPPRRADPWTHALVWPGVAIVGTGAGLIAAAHVRAGRADDAPTEPEFDRRSRSATAMSRAGIVLVSVGA